MVDTIKFSEFADGGDLANDETTVGINGGANARFNNPWTFLKPGTTGDRPTPAVSMYYRLRFNTTLEVYEYYDPTTVTWAQLSGTGTGTVNPGVANDIAFYAANGQSVSPIASLPDAVLVSDGAGAPSMETTLPSGLSIPGAAITASTADLTSGSVVAAPVAGPDLVNKTYADSLFAAGVTSATGTTNQVLVNGVAGVPTSGAITFSLPQDIATGSTPTFAGMTLNSIPLGSSSGGTGINNGSNTLTLAGNLATIGAFASNFTMTGATNVTFPTSGTLATTAGTVSSVSGTANRITSTGGTTPVIDIAATYVGQTSITTLGTVGTGTWQGTVVGATYGGTGVNNGSFTITLGGSVVTAGAFTISGAFSSTFTMTGATSVTFPTSGTLATTAQVIATAAIAGTSQSAAVNTLYIASNAAQTTLTLPSTYAVGDIIGLIGSTANAAGWIIATASGDTIRLNNTTGAASGTLTSAATAGQCVQLICDVANTSWIVTNGTYTTLTLS